MKSPPFTELEDRFVGQLERLASDEDRAALARLRRGLGKPLGFAIERDGWVIRRLPNLSHRELTIYALIASLFAQHPATGGNGGFGRSLRALANLRPAADGGPDPAVEKRFTAVLNSTSEDLGDRLRHVISLLKSNSLAVDWRRLLHDILRWDSSRRSVQINWSRDFWGSFRNSESESSPEEGSDLAVKSE